jgi:nicotinamidase/pyrazinamidase
MTKPTKALIIQDVQVDFLPGGGYPVPKGNEVIDPINHLIKKFRDKHWLIIFTRDWHPTGMNHCVKNTPGAEFPKNLDYRNNDILISKGEDTSDKHFSGFNGDNLSLDKILKENNIKNVFIAGLALDYCVLHTALDAVKYGYNTTVVVDACRAINKNGTGEQKALDAMKHAQVQLVTTFASLAI